MDQSLLAIQLPLLSPTDGYMVLSLTSTVTSMDAAVKDATRHLDTLSAPAVAELLCERLDKLMELGDAIAEVCHVSTTPGIHHAYPSSSLRSILTSVWRGA